MDAQSGQITESSRLKQLRNLIASCSIPDLKRYRKECSDISKSQAAKDGAYLRCEASELRVRCERNAGILLKELRLRGGVGGKLAELGITQNESTRWQLVASVDELVFEEYLADCLEEKRPPSTTRLLALAGKNTLTKREYVSLPDRDPSAETPTLKYDLEELQCHRDLLENLIAPVCQTESDLLRQEEREHVQRLLHSMNQIIQNLM